MGGNKSKKDRIIEWLDIKTATIYFYTRRFFEHWITRWLYELIKKFYKLILSVSLLIFTISFIFFYIRNFLGISFENIFINFQLFLNDNLSIYLYLIIWIWLILFKYILEINKFILKYFINWIIFWTLFILSWIIVVSGEKSFFDSFNYLEYLGIFYLILIIGLFFKFILLLDKKDSKKWYYFNFYKKTYDKIYKNDLLENKIKELIINKDKIINKSLKYNKIISRIWNIKICWKIIYLFLWNKSLIFVKRLKYINKNFLVVLFDYIEILNKIDNIKKDTKLNLYFNKYLKEIKSFRIKQNFIEPIPDEPIWIGNDIFWNEVFSKNIYDILNWINFKKFKKSYSIWIVWEWWGGKSSIINLLDEQFLDWNPNFKVLKFNPWDYKQENLINNFFWELSKILWVKDISNLFKNYLSLVWNINWNIKIWTYFLSWFVWKKSLEDIKKEIDEKLKDFDRKIVIIIDDLDRCEPDEVLMMLNLIKNLWDFNNIIYLVSYDKEHIIKVLENKDFSWDYIEKIINIERFIPIPWKEELKKYFEENFTKILKNIKKNNIELFNEEKREEITNYLIWEFDEFFEKENLRFIKKLLNQLNVILQLNLEKEDSEVFNLEKEDFESIFIINYCKLKDYKLFIEIINLKQYIKNNNWDNINNNLFNISKNIFYIKDLYLFNLLFKKIWLSVIDYKNNYDNFTISDSTYSYLLNMIDEYENKDNLQKREKEELVNYKKELRIIKRNLELIKKYS